MVENKEARLQLNLALATFVCNEGQARIKDGEVWEHYLDGSRTVDYTKSLFEVVRSLFERIERMFDHNTLIEVIYQWQKTINPDYTNEQNLVQLCEIIRPLADIGVWYREESRRLGQSRDERVKSLWSQR